MTRSLAAVLKKASKLSKASQDALASQLNDDIEGELAWDRTLEKSQSLLEKMADKAVQDQKRGRTIKKGFDEL